MDGKFVIVTGVPGVGKTTITRSIAARLRPVVRIGFGELIFETKSRQGATESYEQIRAAPSKLIGADHVSLAGEILLERVNELRKTTNVLLDSHAVVSDWFGFRVIPEIKNFASARLDAIIVIHASFEAVAGRLTKDPTGRRPVSRQSFQKHQAMQDTVAINFSLMAGCPMYLIETDDDLGRSVDVLVEVLESIQMTLERN